MNDEEILSKKWVDDRGFIVVYEEGFFESERNIDDCILICGSKKIRKHIIRLHNESLETMIEIKIQPIPGWLMAYYLMFCAGCKMYLDSGAITENSAIKRAKEFGWEYKDTGWMCPECLEKQEEKKE